MKNLIEITKENYLLSGDSIKEIEEAFEYLKMDRDPGLHGYLDHILMKIKRLNQLGKAACDSQKIADKLYIMAKQCGKKEC